MQPWIKFSEVTFDMLLMLSNERKGRVIDAAARFFKYDERPEDLSEPERIVFERMQADILDSREKYNATCAKNARNAQNAGRKKNPVDSKKKSTGNPLDSEKKSTGREEEIETEIETEKEGEVEGSAEGDKPPRAARFTPPSVAEVKQYCLARGNHVDSQRFVDFYTAKGWRIGKQRMRDWRAAVRTWERDDGGTKADWVEKDYRAGWEGFL